MDLSFFIVRHVTDEITNKYWKEAYHCIRKFYPDIKIFIIDDNSSYKSNEDNETTHCKIIDSEYHGRAELLPYYYFHKLKPSNKAIIIHDSVFINEKINVDDIDTFRFLWEFAHNWDIDCQTISMLNQLNNGNEVSNFYRQKNKWRGCFGAMSIINWDFLNKIETELNFFEVMLKNILNRRCRMCFERIIATVCTFFDQDYPSLHGIIHEWSVNITKRKHWGISFDEYSKDTEYFKKFPIIKVWTGR